MVIGFVCEEGLRSRTPSHTSRKDAMTEDCNCPGEDSPLVADVRAIGDDPRKGEFYKELLPAMLKPQRFTITLDVEIIAPFKAMEAMSHQVVLAEDETLDYLLTEARTIIDELSHAEGDLRAQASDLGRTFEVEWPYECSVRLRPRDGEGDTQES